MHVAERIAQAGARLTAAERRVAEVVLAQPQLVAFGTVAELAEAANAGAATVVRLATKVGFDGFTTLQASVQRDLAHQLRPAAERIREPSSGNLLQRHQQLEVDNVRGTLAGLDEAAFGEVVERLGNPASTVYILSGDASLGVATQFAADLGSLREGIVLINGNDVAVRRTVALMRAGDVLVTLDLRRYDRWVVQLAGAAVGQGVWMAAIVDSVLSPLASQAARTLTVNAAGSGPFDSHVGTLALLNALAAGVADRRRSEASARLEQVERAWAAADALTDR